MPQPLSTSGYTKQSAPSPSDNKMPPLSRIQTWQQAGRYATVASLIKYWWCRGLSQASYAEHRWFQYRCHQSWKGCAKGSAQLSLCNLFQLTPPNQWLGYPDWGLNEKGSLPKNLEFCKSIVQLICKTLVKYQNSIPRPGNWQTSIFQGLPFLTEEYILFAIKHIFGCS